MIKRLKTRQYVLCRYSVAHTIVKRYHVRFWVSFGNLSLWFIQSRFWKAEIIQYTIYMYTRWLTFCMKKRTTSISFWHTKKYVQTQMEYVERGEREAVAKGKKESMDYPSLTDIHVNVVIKFHHKKVPSKFWQYESNWCDPIFCENLIAGIFSILLVRNKVNLGKKSGYQSNFVTCTDISRVLTSNINNIPGKIANVDGRSQRSVKD